MSNSARKNVTHHIDRVLNSDNISLREAILVHGSQPGKSSEALEFMSRKFLNPGNGDPSISSIYVLNVKAGWALTFSMATYCVCFPLGVVRKDYSTFENQEVDLATGEGCSSFNQYRTQKVFHTNHI